jgi:Fe-S cluster assembly protein SufB
VRRPAHQHQQPHRHLPGHHGAGNQHATQHEASVSQVSEEHALLHDAARPRRRRGHELAVNGFVNDLVREFPMEYSVELKRLIDLEMEGSVG